MGLLQAVLLGIALGTDSFSVSVGIGMNRLSWIRILRVSVLFSLLQVVLLVIGFYLSLLITPCIHLIPFFQEFDPKVLFDALQKVFTWFGAAILGGLGLHMVFSFFRADEGEKPIVCYSGRTGLLLLAFTVSIDALTAGLGLGFLDGVALSITSTIVGSIIFLMALTGLLMGRQLHRLLGNNVSLAGGLLMMYLAVYFVAQNL